MLETQAIGISVSGFKWVLFGRQNMDRVVVMKLMCWRKVNITGGPWLLTVLDMGIRIGLRIQIKDGHLGYQAPVYAFVPSIGISNLIQIENELFPYW